MLKQNSPPSTSAGIRNSPNISRQSTKASLVDVESGSNSNEDRVSLPLSSDSSKTSLFEVKEAKKNVNNIEAEEQSIKNDENLPDLGTLLTELRDSLSDFAETDSVKNKSRASSGKHKTLKGSDSRLGSKSAKPRLHTRPESGKCSITSKDSKTSTRQLPETIIRIENECEKFEDGTTIVELNGKFVKKRKQYAEKELADPQIQNYNQMNEERRAYVIENMLMSTFNKRESEFYQECKEKARQERWKAISQQIRMQIQKQIQSKTLKDSTKDDKKDKHKKDKEDDKEITSSKSSLRPRPVKQAFV